MNPMSFRMVSHSRGCVTVDSISTSSDFPNLPNGTATQVRFYYATDAIQRVTENSPYTESEFHPVDAYQWELSTKEFCGFTAGKTFFRYGLIDSSNNLIHFMNDSEYDEYSNAVDVQ